MTAALAQPHSATRRGDGLSRTNLGRDLYQIAELIELCFEPNMDSGGRSAVSEMKLVARLWPLAWLLTLVDRLSPGLGTGYVWRTGGHVVGNVSLYQGNTHPRLGTGWLVANVAVHPDCRQQGIALALMQASLDLARRYRGRWAALQVEADNTAALGLYRALGFETYETLTQWERVGLYRLPRLGEGDTWPVRLRKPGETSAEADLIYSRARIGAMAWTQPIEREHIWDGLFDSWAFLLSGSRRDHWVLPDPAAPDRLVGALWVEYSGWRSARLTLFLDPALRDPRGREALLHLALSLPALEGWNLRLETAAGDALIEEILRAEGFRQMRALTQMRLNL